MAKLTFANYLTYLKREPRTKGWGALLVYDRFKTNMLLAQEHIERFDNSRWLKPISVRVETEGGSWTDVSELTMDKPSLSFVNSNISSSAARLSMSMQGGKLKQLRRKTGSEQIELVGLSRLDPLSAPAVRMNINLNQSNNGTITDQGRVTLDLSEGSAYTFEVSSWKDLNEKVGAAIQRSFAALPIEERVWELNTLKPVEGELNPTSFAVRTHSLANAGQSVASTDRAEQEEGAVVIGVAFNGAKGGDFPTRDQDMPYLLPEPAPNSGHAPYTMNVLLSNASWTQQVLVKLLRSVPGFTETVPSYVVENGFNVGVEFGSANVAFPAGRDDFDGDNWVTWQAYDAFDLQPSRSALNFRVEDNNIVFSWRAVAVGTFSSRFKYAESWVVAEGRKAEFTFTCTKKFVSELQTSGARKGSVIFKGDAVTSTVDVKQVDDTNWNIGPFQDYIRRDTAPKLLAQVVEKFDTFTAAVDAAGVSLDVLRLNSLLFRSEQAAEPESLQAPGDLSLLGTLAPKLTAFAVEPLNASLSAGTSQTFQLTPRPSGTVTWTVDHLPGETGDKGTIVNGVYSAPASETITGTSKRVIVTAKVGDQLSRALVTVVPRSVSVFPFLLSGQFSSEPPAKPSRYVVTGGSLGAPLTWSMAPGAKGTLRTPGAEDSDLDIPVDQEVRIYVAPTKQPGASGTIDSLMQLDTVKVSAGAQTETMDVVLPWMPTTAELKVTAQPGNTLKLGLWGQSWGGGSVEVPPENTLWFLVKGEGTLAETGIYTPGAEGDYIIVAAVDKTSPALVWSYTILPMPYDQAYTELVEHVHAHSTQRKG